MNRRDMAIYGAVILTALAIKGARAGPVQSGLIIPVFRPDSVVLGGNILNSPVVGAQSFSDNSSSAVHSISNSTDFTTDANGEQINGSTLTWGTNTPTGPDTFSSLIIQGETFPSSPSTPTTTFNAAKVTFINGTSATDTIIFGATLDFYVNSVSPSNFLGSDNIVINTTINQFSGTSLNLDQLGADADYLNICGNQSLICGGLDPLKSLHAYEAEEGGVGVTAFLQAIFVGDPQLLMVDMVLAPGQDPLTTGFIGNAAPLAVPEPTSIIVLMSALASLLGLRKVFLA
jgi:hypothetical protein